MRPRSGMPALEYELLEESAYSLGQAAKRMAAALAVLAAAPLGAPQRQRALDDAVDATYAYVVQRDLLALFDTDGALRQYGVPDEVRSRLGARRRTP